MLNPFGAFIGMMAGSLTSPLGLIAALVIGFAVRRWWQALGLGAIAGLVSAGVGMASNGVMIPVMLVASALAFALLATLVWSIATLGRRALARRH